MSQPPPDARLDQPAAKPPDAQPDQARVKQSSYYRL
jgi:hypothetical protein